MDELLKSYSCRKSDLPVNESENVKRFPSFHSLLLFIIEFKFLYQNERTHHVEWKLMEHFSGYRFPACVKFFSFLRSHADDL